jgi:hypothetical protein
LVHAIDGARAFGKWGDEHAGKTPEGIFYSRTVLTCTAPDIAAAHYGWARPLRAKRAKLAAWNCAPGDDPRLDRLHLCDDWRRPTSVSPATRKLSPGQSIRSVNGCDHGRLRRARPNEGRSGERSDDVAIAASQCFGRLW